MAALEQRLFLDDWGMWVQCNSATLWRTVILCFHSKNVTVNGHVQIPPHETFQRTYAHKKHVFNVLCFVENFIIEMSWMSIFYKISIQFVFRSNAQCIKASYILKLVRYLDMNKNIWIKTFYNPNHVFSKKFYFHRLFIGKPALLLANLNFN
jgi:hypothetical protein